MHDLRLQPWASKEQPGGVVALQVKDAAKGGVDRHIAARSRRPSSGDVAIRDVGYSAPCCLVLTCDLAYEMQPEGAACQGSSMTHLLGGC